MDLITIAILAVGLSMDSLAIALTAGAIIGNHKVVNVLKITGMLAVMQMGLTLGGWMVGETFAHYIDRYDHWLAFVILVFLGGKMIFEALRNKKREEGKTPFNPLNAKVMFSLALATSIDAMAVGLSISIVNQPIMTPALIIGLVTFVLSAMGVFFGSKVGRRFNFSICIIGGLILITIGSLILLNHTIWALDKTLVVL